MRRLAAVATTLVITGVATATVVYQTGGPFGGMLGLWGPDVSSSQSVGARFSVTDDFTLDKIRIWVMCNTTTHPPLKLTLRPDSTIGGVSIPSNTVLEEWNINVQAVGWDPIQEVFPSALHPQLAAGQKYWVVAQSTAPGGQDPIWNFAGVGTGFSATSIGATWQPGGSGAALTLIVDATPQLDAADLDGSGAVNGSDLSILLSSWGSCAGCAADLDADGVVGGSDLSVLFSHWNP